MFAGFLGCGGGETPVVLDPVEPGDGFEIRMHRGADVGDVYLIRERWALERTVTTQRDGLEVAREEQRRSAELEAEVLVVAVTSDGEELERRYRVRTFRYDWNGVPGAPIPPGSVIRVIGATDGQGVIEWDGEEELPPDAVAAVRSVVSTVIRPGTDDEVFGTAARQEIGGRWQVDGARAASDLSSIPGFAVAPGGVRGQSILREATQHDGIPCLVVDTELTAELSELPAPREDASVEEATLEVRLRGSYPIERGLPQLAHRRRTTVRARGPVEDGGRFVLEATTTAVRRITPL